MQAEGTDSSGGVDRTTFHVRRAVGGDRPSLEWLLEHFTPLLLEQARYRAAHLAPLYDAQDVVNEVWAIALPRLERIVPREGRYTPVLVKYLSVVLQRRVATLGRKKRLPVAGGNSEGARVDEVWRDSVGLSVRAAQAETAERVQRVLESLGEFEREVFVLRAIEQRPYSEIAEKSGKNPKSLAVFYRRTREKILSRLPDSVIEELAPQ